MGMNVTSSQRPAGALISPVSPRHSIPATHSLMVAIVVLMVLATVALLCCCYLWERQMRLRIEAARTSPFSPHVEDDNHSSRPQMLGSSPSVIVLLRDDIARSVPQRMPTSEAATAQPTQTNASPKTCSQLISNW